MLRRSWSWLKRALGFDGAPTSLQGTSGGYQGAAGGRLMADWIYNPVRSADQEIRSSFIILRARARDLVRNNPYAANYLRYLVSQVLGPKGIGLESRVKQKNGQRFDKKTNEQHEAAWERWGRKGTCTIDGRLSFRDVEKLVLRNVAQDGEVLVRFIRGAPNAFGLALQVLDIDHLNTDFNRPATGGENEVRMGIEMDRWGRPVAYHIFTRHPGETSRDQKRDQTRVLARDMLHIYRPERAGQSRGVTWFASSIWNLRMLAGYIEAELVAARTASAKMGFIVSEPEAEEDPREGGGVDANGPLEIDAEPGTFTELPWGKKVEAWNPEHPTSAFRDFIKTNLRGFSAGQGVNYNLLSSDLEGVNYSSLRGAVLAERDEFKAIQSWYIDDFHERVHAYWFEFALLSGQLALPHVDRDHWSAHEWMRRGWPWVDPLKDLQAAEKEVALGLTTRTRLAAERGHDFEENLEMLAKETALAKELGVKLSDGGTTNAAPQQQSDEEDDDEDADGSDQPGTNGNGRAAPALPVHAVGAASANGGRHSRGW